MNASCIAAEDAGVVPCAPSMDWGEERYGNLSFYPKYGGFLQILYSPNSGTPASRKEVVHLT